MSCDIEQCSISCAGYLKWGVERGTSLLDCALQLTFITALVLWFHLQFVFWENVFEINPRSLRLRVINRKGFYIFIYSSFCFHILVWDVKCGKCTPVVLPISSHVFFLLKENNCPRATISVWWFAPVLWGVLAQDLIKPLRFLFLQACWTGNHFYSFTRSSASTQISATCPNFISVYFFLQFSVFFPNLSSVLPALFLSRSFSLLLTCCCCVCSFQVWKSRRTPPWAVCVPALAEECWHFPKVRSDTSLKNDLFIVPTWSRSKRNIKAKAPLAFVYFFLFLFFLAVYFQVLKFPVLA